MTIGKLQVALAIDWNLALECKAWNKFSLRCSNFAWKKLKSNANTGSPLK
jgi:hypothetical protein